MFAIVDIKKRTHIKPTLIVPEIYLGLHSYLPNGNMILSNVLNMILSKVWILSKVLNMILYKVLNYIVHLISKWVA